MSYDRLGIGQSQQGEPLNEVQSFLEIAALRAVTLMLRNGEFPGQCQNISKIIHVGHSFGALQTYALTAAEPDISDGIVLTGYSADAGFLSYFNAGANWMQAALNVPERHGNLPRGYFVTSGKNALQFEFLLPGYFDPGILDFAEAAKQPVTIGELLTLSAPTSSAFAKPVLVFTGCERSISLECPVQSRQTDCRNSKRCSLLRRRLHVHWRRLSKLHSGNGLGGLSQCDKL